MEAGPRMDGEARREDVVVVVERRSWSGEFVVVERSWREADVTENWSLLINNKNALDRN